MEQQTQNTNDLTLWDAIIMNFVDPDLIFVFDADEKTVSVTREKNEKQ